MLQIRPVIQHKSVCPYCGHSLSPQDILWQGIHICAISDCTSCHQEIVEDLRVGQAIFTPFQVGLDDYQLFGGQEGRWFGEPLQQSLRHPKTDIEVVAQVESFQQCRDVIILNCIDFLYGHSLLKLLNAERHLRDHKELGLIVIIPQSLRWMVPKGVAEIWTVNVPFARARDYYPSLNAKIRQFCDRFDSIYVSLAHSHPREFDISVFTQVEKHDFACQDYRITFVWREDRFWWSNFFLWRIARKLKMTWVFLFWQNYRICRLFRRLRRDLPYATFTVAGFGTKTSFPSWIEDQRTDAFTEDIERRTCVIYSQSRLVIGVHGSNMLLPSAHAGMTLDLVSDDRWGNFAQDVLYQGKVNDLDKRIISFRYRYLPLSISLRSLHSVARSMVIGYETALRYFEVPSKQP